MVKKITQAELKSLVRYELESGKFYWLKTRGWRKAGGIAGWIDDKGYQRLSVKGSLYRGGQLAWLYMTGEFPDLMVDHINRNRKDDRWVNLRLATRGENIRNSKLRSDNKSGAKGVYLTGAQWAASIRYEKRLYWLGRYDSKRSAIQAVKRFQWAMDPVFYG